jgi:hypothetical protein
MKKVAYILAVLLGSAVSLCSCSEVDVNNTDQTNDTALIQLVSTGEKIILKDSDLKAYNKADTIHVMYGISNYIVVYGARTGQKAIIKKYL